MPRCSGVRDIQQLSMAEHGVGAGVLEGNTFQGGPHVQARFTTSAGGLSDDGYVMGSNGRWWIFCSGARCDDNLLIYYADNILGPWRPHAQNPVKTDIHSARPAGPLLQLDGMFYRPTQDCGPTYGGRIALNRTLDK